MYTIYWIRSIFHSCYNTQGYIGITKNFSKRMREHSNAPNHILKNAFLKYKDDILFNKIVENVNEELSLLVEEMLRPRDKIGWNIIKGGGKPPIPTGKQSLGNKSRLGIVVKHFISTDSEGQERIYKGYKDLRSAGFEVSCVRRCISGVSKKHKGHSFKETLLP